MGLVAQRMVRIVQEYIQTNRMFSARDLDYISRLLGLEGWKRGRAAPILRYFPHVCMCMVWNSGNDHHSRINELCKTNLGTHFWWNAHRHMPNRNWVLCEYHPQRPEDVEGMIEILKSKGYRTTPDFPPLGFTWYQQDTTHQVLPFLFWTEPITGNYLGYAGKAEH